MGLIALIANHPVESITTIVAVVSIFVILHKIETRIAKRNRRY